MDRRKLIIQILAVSILCIVLVTLAITFNVFTPKAKSHQVTFRVESSGGIAYITFKDVRNIQKDKLQISTPWEKTWTNPSGTEVYLTAGNPTQMGNVKCIIKIDGKVWRTNGATIPDDSVACAGIVP